ncbi:hypothetical protein [Sphingobium sp. DC-2]|uniref:hypothetical protein n=1 Tax=Sphingobium sp. DC-2 TaxID=1303256 RepID=UPI00068A472B|nr:hypothetical protein [Sphingobium sp. DC-2]
MERRKLRGPLIMEYVALYQQLVGWVVGLFGSDKMAHVVVGLALWFGSAWALRKPFHSLPPLAVLVAAEALNEWLDRITYGSWRWTDTSMDIVATLACPLLILLAQSCVTFVLRRQALSRRSEEPRQGEQGNGRATEQGGDPSRA